ncbi:hypothetical protein [Xenorhabdus sp. KK7.4]|uniref:hypothetical protein n=1 Tax=Xenorhabdus sp. KK7.4 TaxID=1851572 RepID=UPI000C039603|nr:hypothetical protein [Xenorhabdus sp. KK7.4]PHM52087.1 hypothetical protein Xekk_03312 [Xenorhabdus sp. KK7.4]
MAQVKCQYFDFSITTFFEPEVCEPPAKNKNTCCQVTQLRNMKYSGTPSDTDDKPNDLSEYRFIVNTLSQIHLVCEDVPFCESAIILRVQRILACQIGCDTDYNAILEHWRGSGMMIPPGEYIIDIPVGIAYGADLCGFHIEKTPAGHVTVVIEPATTEHVWAMLYNNAKC